jgi:hypothetical protein
MSDFVSGFWSVYVALITLVSVVGCGVFLWMQGKAKATAAASGQVETMGHVWDENLEEYNNPVAALVELAVLLHGHLRAGLSGRLSGAGQLSGQLRLVFAERVRRAR